MELYFKDGCDGLYSINSLDDIEKIPPGCIQTTKADAIAQGLLHVQSAKEIQIKIVTESCNKAIVSGFTSSALGTIFTYPSNERDQTNLIGAVASGNSMVKFWCADDGGVWDLRIHTDTQIRQVLSDAATQRIAYSEELKKLIDQITAATDQIDLTAIVWS